MFLLTLFEQQSYKFKIFTGISFLLTLLLIIALIYVIVHHIRRRKRKSNAIANKRLLYLSPTSIRPQLPTKATNRYVFPLPRLESVESSVQNVSEMKSQISLNELPSNYKTFDLSKRRQRHLSSDSSYTSTANPRLHPLPTLSFDSAKLKIQQVYRRSSPSAMLPQPLEAIHSDQIAIINSSDSDEPEIQPTSTSVTSTFDYSLSQLFRFEIFYKLYYSVDDSHLLFQLIRISPIQVLIERCFPIIICKIRLCTNKDKRKDKKYFSKKNPSNEIFKFDLDQYTLEQSCLKIHIYGQHKTDKRLELGHILLVLNQYENLMYRVGHHHDGGLVASEQHQKSIPIYEDRIDMILSQHQKMSENEPRALICLVYENDRCLLHVGLIKVNGLQTLLPILNSNSQFRDLIQVKIYTMTDGKIIGRSKSKPISINKNTLTFSTSFHFDYVALHKISIRITICTRKNTITSQSKIVSMIDFGSTQLKSQQAFQHWTDTLAAPNRPHIHWHELQSINKQK